MDLTKIGLEQIERAVIDLDFWLDTMRAPSGYGGPIVHWWKDCLQFTGVGLDWRYEGIITGYLNLYQATGQIEWLAKARVAGDDLVRGQLPTGNFRNSSFERNPCTGGTPHEAACDVALLELAHVLKGSGDRAWEIYAETAERNLLGFILPFLWDKEENSFKNTVHDPTFVPNKAATIIEALFAWAMIKGQDDLVEQYIFLTLEAICGCQVKQPNRPSHGAIYQATLGHRRNGRFFPFYIARCIPALVLGFHAFGRQRYLRSAQEALDFILRHRSPDGSFPQVVYERGKVNRYPLWIAGTGDILRAMDLLTTAQPIRLREPTLAWLLDGLQPSCAIATARGFASQVSQRQFNRFPDFRDLIGVCGWADKAFRFLTSLVTKSPVAKTLENRNADQTCLFRGKGATFREDEQVVELRQEDTVIYRWCKGACWPEVCRV
jgi:hypothetical protein